MNNDPATAEDPTPGTPPEPADSDAVKGDQPKEQSQTDRDSAVAETVPAEEQPDTNRSGDGEPTRLDRRWVRLHQTLNLTAFGVLWIFSAITVAMMLFAITAPWNYIVPAVWLLLSILGIVWAIGLPRLSYRHWSYQYDDHVLQIRHGIVWRVTLAIPLSRLQHVDLHRGPVERRFGLSSLEVHTAGTRAASHMIPGLSHDTATELRDQLIDAANRGVHVAAED